MPINAHPEYLAAEKEYISARTLEDKINSLEKMISLAPKHKGAENLLAQLRSRLKRLINQKEKQKKSGKGKVGIKKEAMQAVIVGFTNTGKSSLLRALTNAAPEVAQHDFTTKNPEIGIMKYDGVNIQIIEIPAVTSEYYDRGLVNNSDTVIILINDLKQLKEIDAFLARFKGKRIIVFNNFYHNSRDLRKIAATLQSKKYNYSIISTKTSEGIDLLKKKIFESFGKIRIFTRERGKILDRTHPIILEEGSIVKDAAEKILHGFSNKIKETFITGPSSKFPNQKVGLKHGLKDLDIIEFKTK